MPSRAVRLKKTNIVYPMYDGLLQLEGLLGSLTLTQEILDDIIDFEDSAFANDKDGACFTGLERLIVVARKQRLLTPAKLRRIFFHILRCNHLPAKCGKGDLDILLLAYQDVMSELDRGYPMVQFRLLDGVYFFGYQGQFNLDRELAFTHDDYLARRAVMAQCDKYVSIPGMLAKIERFVPFAGDDKNALRMLALLRTIKYDPIADEQYIDLNFWGFITILLLNKVTRFAVFTDFMQLTNEVPAFGESLAILKRYVDAIADLDLSARFEQSWPGLA